jgi:protein-L-isoaspartate(D-aspartate) O-methyltransferase
MIDSYRHKGLRKRMIALIREKGITDERVLAAMGKIPRHFFLDSAFADHAYENKPFPIDAEQTISQPYTVAYMSQMALITPGLKVLEIGTGSGYQACVLAEMGAEVFSIERHEVLHLSAKEQLANMGYGHVQLYYGDGYAGAPEVAPFDRILVTAGAPEVPVALRMQLAIGGSMVIPVGIDGQVMMRITRTAHLEWKDEPFDRFKFVPFLEGISDMR